MAATQYRDHIPNVPSFFKFLVVAQIVVALAVLGLAAYGATFNDFFAGNGYAIFCCIALLTTSAYYLLTTTLFTTFFNAWVYLGMSFFQAIWWLACWANLASWAGAYKLYYVGMDLSDFQECADKASDVSFNSNSDEQFGGLDGYDDVYLGCLKDRRKKHRDVIGAAAGIGALEWILVIATLVLFGLALWKHRKSGAPFSAGAAWRSTSDNPHGEVRGAYPEIHQMHAKSDANV